MSLLSPNVSIRCAIRSSKRVPTTGCHSNNQLKSVGVTASVPNKFFLAVKLKDFGVYRDITFSSLYLQCLILATDHMSSKQTASYLHKDKLFSGSLDTPTSSHHRLVSLMSLELGHYLGHY